MKKILFILFDGLADTRDAGKTPLQAAKKPNLDWLAANGLTGLIDNGIVEGEMEFSETANFRLLGYNTYPGRGYIEALGAGLKPKEGDICLRCNFATVDPKWIVLDRRAGRDETGLDELARDINKIKIPGCDIIFKRSRGHRGVLILRGRDLSSKISGTDPHQVGKKVLHSVGLGTGRDRSKTERAAKILNRFTELAYEILDGHAVNKMREIPANILLARHPSSVARMESFEHRWGLRAGCVAAVGDVIGAAKAIGIQTKQVGSGHINTDLAAKVRATKQMIKYKDFVLLHIKGADEAAHDRNFSAKKEFIERVDREVVDKVMRLKNIIIVVTTDHVTSCASGSHLPGLVPLLIYGAEGDEVKRFDEHACARGSLGIIKAEHLLERLLAFRK